MYSSSPPKVQDSYGIRIACDKSCGFTFTFFGKTFDPESGHDEFCGLLLDMTITLLLTSKRVFLIFSYWSDCSEGAAALSQRVVAPPDRQLFHFINHHQQQQQQLGESVVPSDDPAGGAGGWRPDSPSQQLINGCEAVSEDEDEEEREMSVLLKVRVP